MSTSSRTMVFDIHGCCFVAPVQSLSKASLPLEWIRCHCDVSAEKNSPVHTMGCFAALALL